MTAVDVALLVRVEIATVATTAAANSRICSVTVSPLSKAASANVMNGCSNCTCDTRAMPPIAMPAFQAKNPIHCENSATYSSASHGFSAM